MRLRAHGEAAAAAVKAGPAAICLAPGVPVEWPLARASASPPILAPRSPAPREPPNRPPPR
jgi:hypothetical protein